MSDFNTEPQPFADMLAQRATHSTDATEIGGWIVERVEASRDDETGIETPALIVLSRGASGPVHYLSPSYTDEEIATLVATLED